MADFFLEHPQYGAFTRLEERPAFTWKNYRSDGRKFKSSAEAQQFQKDHKDSTGLQRCKVVEKP